MDLFSAFWMGKTQAWIQEEEKTSLKVLGHIEDKALSYQSKISEQTGEGNMLKTMGKSMFFPEELETQ